jgi:hypothetical protein
MLCVTYGTADHGLQEAVAIKKKAPARIGTGAGSFIVFSAVD